METMTDFILGSSKNHCRWWLQPWNLNMLAPCTGGRDQDHPQEKEAQEGKMIVWRGLTNSWEKKRSYRHRRKWKIYPKKGWDGWMASPTQWTWVWVSSGSWWRTGKPGVLQSMGSQRVRLDWATELNWMKGKIINNTIIVGDLISHSHLWIDQWNRKLAKKDKL